MKFRAGQGNRIKTAKTTLVVKKRRRGRESYRRAGRRFACGSERARDTPDSV